MNTYTVISRNSGEPIDRHLTAAEAAQVILTDDGRDYDLRQDEFGWTLWSRQQVANIGWTATVATSIHDDRDLAEADVFHQVICAHWARHPEAITDAAYDRMIADLDA